MAKPVFDDVAPTAKQELLVGQDTPFRRLAARGRVGELQVVPPSIVETTTPEFDDVAPTARQAVFVGHETPLRP